MSIVNHVVVRITWSGIENGVNKKKRRKIAQGGNDYEIWKSHRVRWSSFEECQIISRNEDAGTLFYDAPINTFYFDSVEISGIRRLIVDERRQVSKNTRSSLTRSSFRAPFSQVRVNNYRNHSFDSTSSPTLTKRKRERFRGIQRFEPLIRTNSVSSGPFDSCSSSCAVTTIGRYFRLRCLRFLATRLASSWIQEFHKSRLSLSIPSSCHEFDFSRVTQFRIFRSNV